MKVKTHTMQTDFPVEYSEAVIVALEKEFPDIDYNTWEVEKHRPRYVRRHRLIEINRIEKIVFEDIARVVADVTKGESQSDMWETVMWVAE